VSCKLKLSVCVTLLGSRNAVEGLLPLAPVRWEGPLMPQDRYVHNINTKAPYEAHISSSFKSNVSIIEKYEGT